MGAVDQASSSAGAASLLRVDRLQRKLGYKFKDEGLLVRALTHRSASFHRNNERLEYLGDSVLGYVITCNLHRTRQAASEGALTLARSELVRRSTLAEIAHSLSLGDHLALGIGEKRSGARHNSSILADALEATIGAVHEDGGIEVATLLVMSLMGDRLNSSAAVAKDAKSSLQELMQARSIPLPCYRILEEAGPQHDLRFVVSCEIAELGLSTTGEGNSRKDAEKQAAAAMLHQFEVGDERG